MKPYHAKTFIYDYLIDLILNKNDQQLTFIKHVQYYLYHDNEFVPYLNNPLL